MAASSTTVQTAAASSSSDWQNALLAWWHEWHYYLVTNAELYLDKAARVNLRATTSTTTQSLNWSEELSQWYAFGSWPDMTEYHECMKRAYVGLQDIGYWMWLTVRPILYSLVYLLWRTAQSVLGRLLPTIQYAMIEVCRFQLHLSWRQALGELILLVACVSLYKLARYLQKQKYIQRTRRYLQQKKKRVTKVRSYFVFYVVMFRYLHSISSRMGLCWPGQGYY